MEVHGKCKLETHASRSVCKKRGMRRFPAKNRASCALRCPKCQARISFALLSIPRSSKRLLTGLFPATFGGWPGSRAVRDPGTSLPRSRGSFAHRQGPRQAFLLWAEAEPVECSSPEVRDTTLSTLFGRTLPGLENHETRGTRHPAFLLDMPSSILSEKFKLGLRTRRPARP